MQDYMGDLAHWQRQLDAAGIEYDVSNLAGCTFPEIDRYVKNLLAAERKN